MRKRVADSLMNFKLSVMNQISLIHAAWREGQECERSSPLNITDLTTSEWRSHTFTTLHILLLLYLLGL